MSRVFHGKVHGKTIEIDEELHIEDGEQVEVVVKRIDNIDSSGDGIRQSAGAASEIPEFDLVFSQIEHERKLTTFRESLK